MTIVAEAITPIQIIPQQHIIVIAVPVESEVSRMPIFPMVMRFLGFIIIMMFIFFMISYFIW